MRKILLLSIGGAIIVEGLAVFMLLKEGAATVDEVKDLTTTPLQTTDEAAAAFSGTDSMNSLLARGENLECSVSYMSDGEEIATEGTFFTSQNRLRGDFIVSGAPAATLSSVIVKDDTLYSWTEIEGEKYGMKISLSDLEESKKTDNAPDAREVVPLDAKVSYNCSSWTFIDGSIFEPPADVIFKDYADLMNVGMEFGTVYEGASSDETKATQCALCNEVTGQGKAECLAAFACEL